MFYLVHGLTKLYYREIIITKDLNFRNKSTSLKKCFLYYQFFFFFVFFYLKKQIYLFKTKDNLEKTQIPLSQ